MFPSPLSPYSSLQYLKANEEEISLLLLLEKEVLRLALGGERANDSRMFLCGDNRGVLHCGDADTEIGETSKQTVHRKGSGRERERGRGFSIVFFVGVALAALALENSAKR